MEAAHTRRPGFGLERLACRHAAVSDVSVDGHTVRFAMQGDAPSNAPRCSQALLATGARVSHFAAVAEDLQQSYINSLARGPRA
jgi:hypothetical protein